MGPAGQERNRAPPSHTCLRPRSISCQLRPPLPSASPHGTHSGPAAGCSVSDSSDPAHTPKAFPVASDAPQPSAWALALQPCHTPGRPQVLRSLRATSLVSSRGPCLPSAPRLGLAPPPLRPGPSCSRYRPGPLPTGSCSAPGGPQVLPGGGPGLPPGRVSPRPPGCGLGQPHRTPPEWGQKQNPQSTRRGDRLSDPPPALLPVPDLPWQLAWPPRALGRSPVRGGAAHGAARSQGGTRSAQG